MEVEAAEFIGRASYERREASQSTYRNGFKRRRVTTGEGAIELQVPQTRNGPEPFQTAVLGAFQRRSEVLEAMIPQLYVKGLSVRDISDTFKQVLEDEGVSPATCPPRRPSSTGSSSTPRSSPSPARATGSKDAAARTRRPRIRIRARPKGPTTTLARSSRNEKEDFQGMAPVFQAHEKAPRQFGNGASALDAPSARLSLVGLHPRRARLRFTRRHDYTGGWGRSTLAKNVVREVYRTNHHWLLLRRLHVAAFQAPLDTGWDGVTRGSRSRVQDAETPTK